MHGFFGMLAKARALSEFHIVTNFCEQAAGALTAAIAAPALTTAMPRDTLSRIAGWNPLNMSFSVPCNMYRPCFAERNTGTGRERIATLFATQRYGIGWDGMSLEALVNLETANRQGFEGI